MIPHSVLALDLYPMALLQITKHWNNNEKPEMTLEKLQLIASTTVAPPFKVKWNSSIHSRQAVHFPPKGFIDKDLESWLNKASFWARVSNHTLNTS
jgi:hypothetical protein